MKKFALILCMVALCACNNKPKVRYADPNETETVNEDLGRTDVKLTVKTMYKDLARVAPRRFSDRPFVAVREVSNTTNEPFDTRLITDLLEEELLNSGDFRFTTEQADKSKLLDEIDEQEESGLYKQNDRTAKKGNWNPPQYILTGRIKAIKKQNSDVKDVYYQLTLMLTNINGGTIDWKKTREINKRVDRD